ncbi:acetyl-CoA hydrolase/transferase family protein [Acidipropionibacterium jensenii]|uniref:acetyl-CoA hydrolase/transferase family protein n=3 Tax=Acidipropionibacterium jensenii TaxID=1749 RepID=UPI002648B95F|nr:acetyl-CoA hydrolase/transferase family protein [Acidipropionibacterium jensenii]MDN6426881.1 acetyl-CoA hydrolase/transferase family protein [Acidipropionibacterium jensenii]MDN6441956.1 acetyl-CoA hydrolase/transferase family protein [Acidipropionibacterium jensenii]MDN6592545.1 acetyl-CoA hydrolase/transferase family protein [Acidipropionibacterium jensenii]MDN6624787.1 acetyl-CoA hydrolase/transferase family protein [Acidipropionibacterium jensenii]MDN6761548.1 acetyl-CoA hydrolase/tran
MSERIANKAMRQKVMSADDAAALIHDKAQIGFGGFTGSGYPKEFPPALAKRIKAAHEKGEHFTVNVFTGASTAPELDGELAGVDGIGLRSPYQSDPMMRAKINDGTSYYDDIHLSQFGMQVREGFFGKLDFAVIEATKITADGNVIPTSSIGNNAVYIEKAEKIIIEVNDWQSEDLEGMHDIYYGFALPPHRVPIPITHPGDRIGETYLRVPANKVVAVIETHDPDRNSPFKPIDEASHKIAGYLLDFYDNEVAQGRMPKNLLPLQSGVGNIPNAVLDGLLHSDLEHLTSYTEVIQDGMIDLIDAGKIDVASATAFSLSPDYAHKMNVNAAFYRNHIILRPQEISNHPEVIRRLGVLGANGMIEADIYGNVNSTHVMGSRMMNGIGGSGDFTRNAFISAFVSPSTAKGGKISAIVPMVSHVDHTEHDTMVIITEQGIADLRGLAPRQRAPKIIENCAHPDYKEMLSDYYERALRDCKFKQTPHLLNEAYSWHTRFLANGTMKLN